MLRGVLLVAMVCIFIAGTYAGVRLLHLALYVHASRRGRASWSAIAGFATTVVIGMVLLAGATLVLGALAALDTLAAPPDAGGQVGVGV